MIISQIEHQIRQLPYEEQLQLLSWLVQYIHQHLPTSQSKSNLVTKKIKLAELDYPHNQRILN